MGLLNIFRKKEIDFSSPAQTIVPVTNSFILTPVTKKNSIEESLKGLMSPELKKSYSHTFKNKEWDHPFDFSNLIKLYKQYGFLTGVVDKHVDFIVGSGFYVESEDKRAEKIITDYLRDINFDSLLRNWVRTALITGNGFLEVSGKQNEIPTELKILNPCYMYIRKDEKGLLLGYSQIIKAYNQGIQFEPYEIIHLSLAALSDSVYGCGIVYPALPYIDNLIAVQKDMHEIIHRKANNPYIIKVGNIEKDIMPTQAQLDAIGEKLESLTNKQEWVTDAAMEIYTVDFGKTGEKFDSVLRHDEDQLFFTFQVPEVLMGRGSIPEGLAQVQMQAWERRIQSFQSEIEKVIETQLFQRILIANGLSGIHVEFQWGEKSDDTKNAELMRITELLKVPFLSPKLMQELEKRIALLLDFKMSLESPEEEKKGELEDDKQPIVPGQNRNIPESLQLQKENFKEEDYTIREWLGFNYRNYMDSILLFLSKYTFEKLKAKNKIEEEAGKLSELQVNALKGVFIKGISNNWTLNRIASEIDRRVAPQDLFKLDTSESSLIQIKEAKKLLISGVYRAIAIARTEMTYIANQGALLFYDTEKIEEVRWVAALSDRTCPICEDLNGGIFTIAEAREGAPPAHENCRCTIIPITKLS